MKWGTGHSTEGGAHAMSKQMLEMEAESVDAAIDGIWSANSTSEGTSGRRSTV